MADLPITSEQFATALQAYFESKRRTSRPICVRSSDVGHPCDAYLVYSIRDWDKAAPPDWRLLAVFEEGIAQEGAVAHLVETILKSIDPSIQVLHEHRTFYYPDAGDPLISGRLDRLVMIQGKLYPMEIKTVSPNLFPRLNCADDLLHAQQYYIRKWAYQVQCYMFLTGFERALFVLKNKGSQEVKIWWHDIQWDLLDYIERLAARVMYLATHGMEGDKLNDPRVCDTCPFLAHCKPSCSWGGLIYEYDEFIALLEERQKLLGAAKRFEEIDRIIKEQVKRAGHEFIKAGDYTITAKKTSRGVTVKIQRSGEESSEDEEVK
jgi:hypothetical protein